MHACMVVVGEKLAPVLLLPKKINVIYAMLFLMFSLLLRELIKGQEVGGGV